MKRIAFFLITLLITPTISLFAAPQCPRYLTCQDRTTTHGTVLLVDEKDDCWAFVSDKGDSYDLVAANEEILVDGLMLTITGCVCNVFTVCRAGDHPFWVLAYEIDETKN